eukprot:TRINITY_DN4827_c0_g2_i1.p1 TRINITY_DN4827_c0_g2~~TRINITY_DN4827_c0_g2_i1.p1  ORF type:complete len:353 (+),score=89.68 TRINITY_DN4827_c0_g2_i1:51-1109(+)
MLRKAQYWKLSDQRRFFDELGKKLQYKQWEDWYQLTPKQIEENGGGEILKFYYKASIPRALATVYPEVKWKLWKMNRVPPGFWKNKQNQRAFLEDLGNHLGFKTFDDWYQINYRDVKSFGGAGLLFWYKESLHDMIAEVFNEVTWDPGNFAKRSQGFWKDVGLQRDALDKLGKSLGVRSMEDWYKVTTKELPGGILHYYNGSMFRMLQKVYPEHNWVKKDQRWDWANRKKAASKTQSRLFGVVRSFFPSETEIFGNYVISVKEKIEVDIAIPSLNLAFEYQGRQHYKQTNVYGKLEQQQAKDQQKRLICQREGISLIEVPFSWNGEVSEIYKLITEKQPGLSIIPPGYLQTS